MVRDEPEQIEAETVLEYESPPKPVHSEGWAVAMFLIGLFGAPISLGCGLAVGEKLSVEAVVALMSAGALAYMFLAQEKFLDNRIPPRRHVAASIGIALAMLWAPLFVVWFTFAAIFSPK